MTPAPQLWVFAGPNGAGKSTLARRYVVGRLEIVNPDDIARQIAPGLPADRKTAVRAGRLAVERRKALLDARESFAIETTLTGQGARAFMLQARERGYKVNLVFIGLHSIIQAQSRVTERVRQGGHAVPKADIERRFVRCMNHLAEAMRIADRVLVLDNSGKRRRLILIRENGRTKLLSRNVPNWARTAIPEILQTNQTGTLNK
ncbi:AAA family ATPase [Brucella sp. IR073]|uniref:AAA family ATPase n=1 Tax=unclassified Brucella TaxID=2632610 RepID=UPI003B987254